MTEFLINSGLIFLGIIALIGAAYGLVYGLQKWGDWAAESATKGTITILILIALVSSFLGFLTIMD